MRQASWYDKGDCVWTYVVSAEVVDVGLGQHGVARMQLADVYLRR